MDHQQLLILVIISGLFFIGLTHEYRCIGHTLISQKKSCKSRENDHLLRANLAVVFLSVICSNYQTVSKHLKLLTSMCIKLKFKLNNFL